MKKFSAWLKGLSRTGRIVFISAVAITGLAAVSATATPSTTPIETTVQPVVTTKTETRTEVIPFEKQSVNSTSLAKGKSQVKTAGVNGEKLITDTITLTNGVETKRTSAEEITKQPVTEVTLVGTYEAPKASSNCDSNYTGGCVPIVSYDLDCGDIRFEVRVVDYDRHNFDGDGDGRGCESY